MKKRMVQSLGALTAVAALGVALFLMAGGGQSAAAASASAFLESGDLLIPIAEVSATAVFYPVEIDGVSMEIIAVQASDGSARTAFNTCQVCYDSGRGYYQQEGDDLVCQNCGNRFRADDVELSRGGCNPIPITGSFKRQDGDTIVIDSELLQLAKEVFASWKA